MGPQRGRGGAPLSGGYWPAGRPLRGLTAGHGQTMRVSERWKRRADQARIEVYALYLAYRDPRVPWHARLFAAVVVGYAFSPIDLIPDPIPILGYLDDLLLVPLGVIIALRMIPGPVMDDCRERAQLEMEKGGPTNRVAAVVIIGIWVVVALLALVVLSRCL